MSVFDFLSVILLFTGAFFFFAGTVGLLRFPDVYTRMHALVKADNLGLGFIVMGLIIQAPNLMTALKLVLIWLLALAASATVGFLIAGRAFDKALAPWRRKEKET